jgi:hypothetical protein
MALAQAFLSDDLYEKSAGQELCFDQKYGIR